MKDKEKLTEIIHKYWKKHGLDLRIDPSDQRMIDWYVDKCLDLLPDLYRELEVAGVLPPNSSYINFLKVFEFQFNKKRHEAIFGDLL